MPQSPNATATSTATTAYVKPTRPLLRVMGNAGGEYFWIHKGKQGSLQTAAQMARLVREDTVRDEGLQRFAAQLLINSGLSSHSSQRDIVSVVFAYVKQLSYIHDPAGSFDSIQSARQTIAKGFGDCDDLSVLLATLLAQLGMQPRFVLARYREKSKGFDHVYVDVVLSQREGGRIVLDPSAARRGPGWESPKALERLTYPIFAGPVSSLSGTMNLALTGAAVGLNFVPVVGPYLSALVQPIASLFSRQQQRTEEQTRDQYRDQVYQGLAQIQAQVDACQISPQAGQQQGRALITQMYAACDQFTKKSVAQSCRNYETQDTPGGAQEGAFATRLSRIATGGGKCSGSPSVAANGGTAVNNGATFTANLPMLLLVAGGIYFAYKVL
jgi:hypothetical protein